MRPQNINRITGVEFACRGFENVNLNVIYTSSLFVVFMFLQHGIALSCTDAIMTVRGELRGIKDLWLLATPGSLKHTRSWRSLQLLSVFMIAYFNCNVYSTSQTVLICSV